MDDRVAPSAQEIWNTGVRLVKWEIGQEGGKVYRPHAARYSDGSWTAYWSGLRISRWRPGRVSVKFSPRAWKYMLWTWWRWPGVVGVATDGTGDLLVSDEKRGVRWIHRDEYRWPGRVS